MKVEAAMRLIPLIALLLLAAPAHAGVITFVDDFDGQTYTLNTDTFQRLDDWWLPFDDSHQYAVIGIILGRYGDAGDFFRLDAQPQPTQYFKNWQAMAPVMNGYMNAVKQPAEPVTLSGPVSVPEPSTLLLSALGIGAVFLRRTRPTCCATPRRPGSLRSQKRPTASANLPY